MPNKFVPPKFDSGCLRVTAVDEEFQIYGTKAGIEKLIGICQELLDKPYHGHLHLDDYNVLTEDSLNGVVAIFPDIPKETPEGTRWQIYKKSSTPMILIFHFFISSALAAILYQLSGLSFWVCFLMAELSVLFNGYIATRGDAKHSKHKSDKK